MPIYEYECTSCQKTFETLQKITDQPLTNCILCEKGPVKKLISRSSFILKGTGWYETDFKGKKPSTTATAESLTPASSEKVAQEKSISDSTKEATTPATTAAPKAEP